MVAQDESLWTPADLAAFLRRTRRWVFSALARDPGADGSIPHVRLPGGAPRFVPAVIRAWLEAGCPPAATFASGTARRGLRQRLAQPRCEDAARVAPRPVAE